MKKTANVVLSVTVASAICGLVFNSSFGWLTFRHYYSVGYFKAFDVRALSYPSPTMSRRIN